MPNPRKSLPRYLKHSSGKARIVWTDSAGTRREKVLPGAYDSPESREAFARLQLELATSPAAPAKLSVTDTGPTIAEVFLAYLKHATSYYGKTTELRTIKEALRIVRELYGFTPAGEFGPKALAAVRESFIRRRWARAYINRQMGRVTRAFKWAAAEELLPVTVFQALKTLATLRAGKSDAKESEARTPADVEATLPHLTPHVREMIELLRATGMRPGEACRMTLGQIDRSKELWVYTMAKHKTAHKGKSRVVVLGPAAQEILVRHLGVKVLGPEDPVFCPSRQRDERYEAMRAARKSKVTPSQVCRKKATAKRLPGRWFHPEAVCHAVHKACETAGIAKWSPYRLRHLRGAELREKFSLEHVRAALGHSHASMTAHYAQGADATLASEVARKVG